MRQGTGLASGHLQKTQTGRSKSHKLGRCYRLFSNLMTWPEFLCRIIKRLRLGLVISQASDAWEERKAGTVCLNARLAMVPENRVGGYALRC